MAHNTIIGCIMDSQKQVGIHSSVSFATLYLIFIFSDYDSIYNNVEVERKLNDHNTALIL